MESICLDKLEIDHNLIKYYFTVSKGLKRFFNTDVMFLEYDQDISDLPVSILSIPFVSCMAGLSWLTNSMLFVDEIDKTFYDSFLRIKRAYQELHYSLTLKGLLVPSVFVKNEIIESEDSLLLFGGGVDCHCSFLRNKDRISRICNIYGWLPSVDTIDKVDESDRRVTERFAQQMKLQSHHVRSNFAYLFNSSVISDDFKTSYWYSFLHSMAFISISSLLCFNNNVSSIIIGSSFTKGRGHVKCGSYITTDSEFEFAKKGKVIHDAFGMDRQAKVRYLVGFQQSLGREYPLQACSFNDHNCCECEKCFRTILEIVAEGGDPRDFGFYIEGSLKDHWLNVITRDIALWGVSKESYYYDLAIQRMHDNYDNIQDKEFVDWILNFNFHKAKQKGLRRYYCRNFFSIIKRKLNS